MPEIIYFARCPEHGLHGQRDDCHVCSAQCEQVPFIQAEGYTDPRELGGAIAGPGGPFDFGENVIDTSRAILVDHQEVAKLDAQRGARGQVVFALLFEGRINQSEDRAKVMLLGDLDFLAATITQCHGVAERAGWGWKLNALCEVRWQEMPHEPA